MQRVEAGVDAPTAIVLVIARLAEVFRGCAQGRFYLRRVHLTPVRADQDAVTPAACGAAMLAPAAAILPALALKLASADSASATRSRGVALIRTPPALATAASSPAGRVLVALMRIYERKGGWAALCLKLQVDRKIRNHFL